MVGLYTRAHHELLKLEITVIMSGLALYGIIINSIINIII